MSIGSQGRFAIDTVAPIDASSIPIEIQSESLVKTASIIETSGIRGTRQHVSERTRVGNYAIGGTIEMFPSPEELASLLAWVTGTSASPFIPAETVPARTIGIDRIAKCFTYDGVYVARATIAGAEGEPMSLTLECVGQTETIGNAGAFSAVPLPVAGGAPFIFTDCTGAFSLAGGAKSVKSFSMTIDNMLDVAYNNSLSASRITAADLGASVSITTPYTSAETALYDTGVTGQAMSAVFTHTVGGYSLTIAGFFQPVGVTPSLTSKGELVMRLDGMLRKLSSANSFTLTLDSTA